MVQCGQLADYLQWLQLLYMCVSVNDNSVTSYSTVNNAVITLQTHREYVCDADCGAILVAHSAVVAGRPYD